MLDVVFDAFEMIREEQDESGTFDVELDGMRGFIFVNRYGSVQTPQSIELLSVLFVATILKRL